MALTMLPEKPIPLRIARDWARYDKNLGSTPLVKRYLRNTLRSWVENPGIHNPLALPWLRVLFDESLSALERHLSRFEGMMGEANLGTLFGELPRTSGPKLHIRRDIPALFGEVMAFKKLRKAEPGEITKIEERGDWQCDEVVVSVKTILDIDDNYSQIEESIEGNAWLEEYPALRSTQYFRVSKGEGLDNKFMSKIMTLIDFDLEATLVFLSSSRGFPDWYSSSMEVLRIPEATGGKPEQGRFLFKGSRHDSNKMSFELEDSRAKTPCAPHHKVQFSFECRKRPSHNFTTNNDLNAWYGAPEVDEARLGRHLAQKLSEIEQKNKSKGVSDLAAWINVVAHPSLQIGMANQPDRIREFLARVAAPWTFTIVFLVYGGFELSEPLLFRFGSKSGPLSFLNTD